MFVSRYGMSAAAMMALAMTPGLAVQPGPRIERRPPPPHIPANRARTIKREPRKLTGLKGICIQCDQAAAYRVFDQVQFSPPS